MSFNETFQPHQPRHASRGAWAPFISLTPNISKTNFHHGLLNTRGIKSLKKYNIRLIAPQQLRIANILFKRQQSILDPFCTLLLRHWSSYKEGMRKNSVKVCIRTRPTQYFAQDKIKIDQEHSTIQISTVGEEEQTGILNNKQSTFKFRFDHVFHNASQSSVYDLFARDTVQGVMDGINGAILSYGQTGSGKTFTMVTFIRQVISKFTRNVNVLYLWSDGRCRQLWTQRSGTPMSKSNFQRNKFQDWIWI